MARPESGFFKDVMEVVRQIPPGKATSYGAIARYLGTAGSARMVGWALHQSIGVDDVPAHRVVNRNGMLTGRMHFATPDKMRQLLEAEGFVVQNDQIQNFSHHFWDPSYELGL